MNVQELVFSQIQAGAVIVAWLEDLERKINGE
jgi:hypothetical protein